MASPFKYFRKHQKLMLATLTLLAMFGFVFLPITLQIMGTASARNPVVVTTTKYGDIRLNELRTMIWQRQKVLQFIEGVSELFAVPAANAHREANALVENARELAATGRDAGNRGSQLLEEAAALRQEAAQLAQMAAAVQNMKAGIGRDTEEDVVDTWMYAQHAEHLGLVVSEQAVVDFLRELTNNSVTWQQFEAILDAIHLEWLQMERILRRELLALRLRQMFRVSLAGATPGQRWDYYTRLRRMATIEVSPVPVADFVGEVKDPDEETLRKFFEKYKDEDSNPSSPDPGFRRPYKIAVAYFKAEFEKFLDPDAVTDEEITEQYKNNKADYDWEYEQRKEFYDRLYGEAKEGEDQGQEAKDKQPGETEKPQEEQQDKTDEPPQKEDAEKVEEADDPAHQPSEPEESSSTGNAPSVTPGSMAQEEAPDQGTPEAEQPVPGSQDPAGEPEKPEAEGNKGASQTEPPPTEPGEPPEEPKAPAVAPAKPPPGPETTAPKAQSPSETPGPDEEAAGQVDEPKAEPPVADTARDLLSSPIGKMIRQELAGQKAREKIDEIFGRLQSDMKDYHDQYTVYEAGGGAQPQPPDFKALAEEHGLASDTTGLTSQLEVQDDDIGRSYVGRRERDLERSLQRSRPFVESAFDRGWPTFQPEASFDLLDNRYLFWKVAETKPRPQKPRADEDQSLWHGTLEFEDQGVQEEVLRAWKMVQARELATKKAEALAEKARKLGKSLEQALPDREVTLTQPFSWLTQELPTGTGPPPPKHSEVTGVDLAGPDFMRSVFGLKKGQIGVAMNHPQKIAYVVRVTELHPPEKQLWDGFQQRDYFTYSAAGGTDRWEIEQAWKEALVSDAGLEWAPRSDWVHRE